MTWETVGPFERLSITPRTAPHGAQHSVFRVGDALVDTGSSRVTDDVLDALSADPPRRILLTHQHEDHVGNLGPLLSRFGPMPVHAPRALVDFLPTFRTAPPYRHAYWGSPHPIPADCIAAYDDGDEFVLGGVTLRARHTPGHTPPHHAFVADSGGYTYVLSGDLYASKPFEAFLESALDDTVRTYRALAEVGPSLVLVPTHGRVKSEAAHTLLSEAADFLEREAERIESRAAQLGTRDAVDVSESLYGPDPFHVVSGGEMGRPIFVRSVLDPVRTLPVAALPVRRS